MNRRAQNYTETNTNNVTGSTFHGSPVIAGTATVNVHQELGATAEQEALDAVAQLRAELAQALAQNQQDEATNARLQLADSGLDGLQRELEAGPSQRDPEKVKRLLTGIRDTVAGLAGIVTGVDGLWAAVQNVLR